jgi:hypothetical protein
MRATGLLPLAAVGLGLLVACGGGGGSSSASVSAGAPVSTASTVSSRGGFTATLTGTQEVPPRTTSAAGTGNATVDPATRTVNAALATTGIAATAASIRVAPPGATGPLVLPLAQTTPGSGVWTGSATLTVPQLSALAAGNFYFEVQSAAFPTGEIRGQIVLPNGAATTGVTTAVSPGTSSGIGSIDIGAVSAPGTASGIGTVNIGSATAAGTTAGVGSTSVSPAIAVGSSSAIGKMDLGSVTTAGTSAGIGTTTGVGTTTGIGSQSAIGSVNVGSVTGAGIASGVGTAPTSGTTSGIATTSPLAP